MRCQHPRCRFCRPWDRDGGGVPAVVSNTNLSTPSGTVKTERRTFPRLLTEDFVRSKTKTGQGSIAGGHELIRSPTHPAERDSLQGESRSTSPDEAGPQRPTPYSKSNHDFSTDASQIDDTSEASYSDSGYHSDALFNPRASYIGVGSRVALFLLEDERLGPLLSEAYRLKGDALAFSNDLTEDLGIYSKGLSLEKSDEHKSQAGAFISSKKEHISEEICARVDNMSISKFNVLRKGKMDKQATLESFLSQDTGDAFGIESAEAPRQELAGESFDDTLHDDRVLESSILSGPAFEEMIQRIKFNNASARSTRQVEPIKKEQLTGRCPDQTPPPSPTAMDERKMLPWAKQRKVFSKLIEPSLPAGKRRVRWQCCCGDFLWDDYSNSTEHDLYQLEKELGRFFRSQQHGSGDCRRCGSPFGPIAFVRQLFTFVTQLLQKPASCDAEGTDLEDQGRAGVTEQDDRCQSMLLTSVTRGSDFPTLVQKSSTAVNSDQQYFRMLRNIYEPKKWSVRWWAELYTIVAIRYVRVSAAIRLFEDSMKHLYADVSFNSWKSCTMTMCTSQRSPTGRPIRGMANTRLAKATSPNLNSSLLSLT